MASSQSTLGNSANRDPQAIFATVYEKFKHTLPQDIQNDLMRFKDSSKLVENFNQLAADSLSRPGRAGRSLQMIARIADTLRPYFEVVDIYVQSHPEYAGLVWGTLRFIFTVATNYSTFLAKIENILLRMANALPNFERFLKQLHQSEATIATEAFPHLGQALANIYSDILDFCYRLCRLLYPHQKGIRSRLKIFNTMVWKPFDTHFAEIIEKFELHSEFFQDIMQTTSAVTAMAFEERWKSHMAPHIELSMEQLRSQQKSHEQTEKRAIDSAVEAVQQRVAAPAWAATFEHARNHRVYESGEWLLSHPLFAGFLEERRTVTGARHKNVFLIYGKPGYGKTTLATVVVDHLNNTAPIRENCLGSLAYFFFDNQSRFNTAHDAFRALLAQLIFCRRFDRIVLDIAAIARLDHDTGQLSASDDEIFAILHLFLLQFGNCSIVCDGIDECEDRDEFLRKLSRLASDHDGCNFILFSRPILKIHKELRCRCETLELDHTQNIKDLKTFVQSKVEELIDSGELVLSKAVSSDDIVSTISHRANGIFLWAALFLGYLSIPSLSISQRREAIDNAEKFDGLYSLYDNILAFINKEYPGRSRQNIRRALSWVVGAFRPLRVNELQTAIAQMEAKPFQKDDIIPNFTVSIGPITGALLEVTKDQTVRLIHITAAEYLMSTSAKIAPSFQDEDILDFKPAVLQRYLATTCLAYLSHTVPIGPYVDRYTKGSEFRSVLKEYPLFDYTSRFWTAHLREYIQQFATPVYAGYFEISEELGKQATAFLSDKTRYTSWIESLWHLNCPREAWVIEDMDWSEFQITYSDNGISKAVSLLHSTYEEHQTLLKSWGHVLRKYPEEIWQPSISAFSPSELRKTSTQAEILSIIHDSENDQNWIILQTKCSSSGDTIGVLLGRYQPTVPSYLGTFSVTVKYQIRSLNNDDIIFETTVDVPNEDVEVIRDKEAEVQPAEEVEVQSDKEVEVELDKGVDRAPSSYTDDNLKWEIYEEVDDVNVMVADGPDLYPMSEPPITHPTQRPIQYDENYKFVLETSISATLMEVVVGSTLIKLGVSIEASGPQFQSTKHILQFMRDNSGFKRRGPSLWKLILSPGAEFILLLRKGGTLYYARHSFDIDLFQDPNCRRRPMDPKFVWVAWRSLDTVPLSPTSMSSPSGSEPSMSNSSPSEAFEPVLHFHPTLPQVVYSCDSGTYLWNFCSLLHSTVHEVYREHVQIYPTPLRNIRIADSGNLLYGFDGENVTVLGLANYQQVFGKPRVPSAGAEILGSAGSIASHLGELDKTSIVRETSSRAQPGGTAMLVKDTYGSPAISILRQNSTDGSLVQETLDSHGYMRSQNLVHLPRSLANNSDFTLLRKQKDSSQEDSERVRVLLGVPPKASYSIKRQRNAPAEVSLPAIFEREESSISVVEHGLPQRLIETATTSSRGPLPVDQKEVATRT
jgi:Cdc6-like AAA superfamily ATPase